MDCSLTQANKKKTEKANSPTKKGTQQNVTLKGEGRSFVFGGFCLWRLDDLIRKGQEFNFLDWRFREGEERLRIVVDLVPQVSSSKYELCLVSINRVPSTDFRSVRIIIFDIILK